MDINKKLRVITDREQYKTIRKATKDLLLKLKDVLVKIRVGLPLVYPWFSKKAKKLVHQFKKRNLSTENVEKDLLHRKVFAKEIADKIEREHQKGEHTVLAISAKWGSGKTWLLEEIEPILKKKGFSVVTFNAWHYSQEKLSLKRSFLKTLKKGLKSHVELDNLYQDTTSVGINFKLIGRLGLALMVLFFLPWVIDTVTRTYSQEYRIGVESFLKKLLDSWEWFYNKWVAPYVFVKASLAATFTIPLLAAVSKIFSFEKSTAKITEADEFEDKFNEIIGKRKRVAIFVDDLDRCTPEAVKQILDALTTFFEHKSCSFIVTGDHTVIERYVGDNLFLEPDYDGNGNENKKSLASRQRHEGRRFLKKIFNVYWQLPQPDPNTFKNFVSKKIKESELQFSEEHQTQLTELLTTFLDKNLREVIRFIDALVFTLNTIENMIEEKETVISKLGLDKVEKKVAEGEIKNLKTVQSQPVLLAKTLLIQELFYPVYELHVQHHSDILLQEKALRNTQKLDTMFMKPVNGFFFDDYSRQQYIELIKTKPQFTDEKDNTVFDPDTFWYLSGVTGLPSNRGPDSDKFLQLIKLADGYTEIEKGLAEASADTKKRLLELTKEYLETVADVADKTNAIANSLKLALKVFTWASITSWMIPLLKKEAFINSVDPAIREKIAVDLFALCYKHHSELVSIFEDEFFSTAEFNKYKWVALDQNTEFLHSDVVTRLSSLIENDLNTGAIAIDDVLQNLGKLAQKVNPDDPTAKATLIELLKKFAGYAYDHLTSIETFKSVINQVSTIDSNKELADFANQKETEALNGDQWLNSLPRFEFLRTTVLDYYGGDKVTGHIDAFVSKLIEQGFEIWSPIVKEFIEKGIAGDSAKANIANKLVHLITSNSGVVKQTISQYLKDIYGKLPLEQHILSLVNTLRDEQDGVTVFNILYVVDDFVQELRKHRPEQNIIKRFVTSENAEVNKFANSIVDQINPRRKKLNGMAEVTQPAN